jgi:hypothetical protein
VSRGSLFKLGRPSIIFTKGLDVSLHVPLLLEQGGEVKLASHKDQYVQTYFDGIEAPLSKAQSSKIQGNLPLSNNPGNRDEVIVVGGNKRLSLSNKKNRI